MYFSYSENKGADLLRGYPKLFCAFVFTFAKGRFSHDAALLISGPLMKEDKILQVMPSVVLALHLLCELRSPESTWKPYLDILYIDTDIEIDCLSIKEKI